MYIAKQFLQFLKSKRKCRTSNTIWFRSFESTLQEAHWNVHVISMFSKKYSRKHCRLIGSFYKKNKQKHTRFSFYVSVFFSKYQNSSLKATCILLSGGYDWSWGGCSDNVKVGEKAAKKLLDTLVTKRDGAAAMHLHNNMAGRKVRRPATLIQHDLVFNLSIECLLFGCRRSYDTPSGGNKLNTARQPLFALLY